jgi:hypothetical protein
MVGLADGGYLLEVEPAVAELEEAPLVNAEGAEDDVAGAGLGGTEELVCLDTGAVETCKLLGGGMGELFAGEWSGCSRWDDRGRSLATAGKKAEVKDGDLHNALVEGRPDAGGRTFEEPGFEGGCCREIGKQQMFDDLLDAPFGWTGCGWAKLGL